MKATKANISRTIGARHMSVVTSSKMIRGYRTRGKGYQVESTSDPQVFRVSYYSDDARFVEADSLRHRLTNRMESLTAAFNLTDCGDHFLVTSKRWWNEPGIL